MHVARRFIIILICTHDINIQGMNWSDGEASSEWDIKDATYCCSIQWNYIAMHVLFNCCWLLLASRSIRTGIANLIHRLMCNCCIQQFSPYDFINLFFIKILNFLSCRISFQSIPFFSLFALYSVLHFFCLYMAMLLLQLELGYCFSDSAE